MMEKDRKGRLGVEKDGTGLKRMVRDGKGWLGMEKHVKG
jgi:hypothetical protein